MLPRFESNLFIYKLHEVEQLFKFDEAECMWMVSNICIPNLLQEVKILKFSFLIGWPKVRACSLMLLWVGVVRGRFVLKDNTFMLSNSEKLMFLGFANVCGLTLSTTVFKNNTGRYQKGILFLKRKKDWIVQSLTKMQFNLIWEKNWFTKELIYFLQFTLQFPRISNLKKISYSGTDRMNLFGSNFL